MYWPLTTDLSTYSQRNILDLLFTNVPKLVECVTVLGHKEACASDHYGINFKVKLDVSLKKTIKREIYDFSKAYWKNLNFELNRVKWHSLLGMQDPHQSWNVFKTVVHYLIEKIIPKKSTENQFQPPWFDTDCERV